MKENQMFLGSPVVKRKQTLALSVPHQTPVRDEKCRGTYYGQHRSIRSGHNDCRLKEDTSPQTVVSQSEGPFLILIKTLTQTLLSLPSTRGHPRSEVEAMVLN